jgi:hypothetical protein
MIGTYDIVTRVDGKSDSDEILSILTDISAGRRKNDLKLVNYYQEMPISYGAVEIDECRGGALELTIHQNQTVVIAHQKQTVLKSNHFPDGLSVHAIVDDVNVKKSYVVLGRFAYTSIKAERRNAVRVKLQESVQVNIKADGATYTGILADISVSGIKIKDSELPSNPANAFIDITFSGAKISLPGTFLRENVNENGHFHVFTIAPDTHSEGVISKLIYNRQIEIIQMLKDQILVD